MSANVLAGIFPEERISKLLAVIGQPVRIQILVILGAGEACVCHMRAVMGVRQASISQHLMVLRQAGLVITRREGRNIFYQVNRQQVVDVLRQAADLTGLSPDALAYLTRRPAAGCACPHCNPGQDPGLKC